MTEMRSLKSLITATFALLTLVFLVPAVPAHAQFPAYLHAISDLRSARAYLQQDTRPQFEGHRHRAIDEISRAIDDMKKAAVDDGKNLGSTPPPQSGGNPGAPIHTALRLLEEARRDVASGADSPENRGLQVRSLQHIDKAQEELHHILDSSM
jgi:hypothetical protein